MSVHADRRGRKDRDNAIGQVWSTRYIARNPLFHKTSDRSTWWINTVCRFHTHVRERLQPGLRRDNHIPVLMKFPYTQWGGQGATRLSHPLSKCRAPPLFFD